MIFGMTMVKVRPGQESSVYLVIRAIKGIKDVYRIFGEFSFFLIIDAYERKDLDKIVEEIRMIRNVVEIQPILVTADDDSNLACLGHFESAEHVFSWNQRIREIKNSILIVGWIHYQDYC